MTLWLESVTNKSPAWWMDYAIALFVSTLNEKEDAAYFSGQSWSFPFDPSAAGGDFV